LTRRREFAKLLLPKQDLAKTVEHEEKELSPDHDHRWVPLPPLTRWVHATNIVTLCLGAELNSFVRSPTHGHTQDSAVAGRRWASAHAWENILFQPPASAILRGPLASKERDEVFVPRGCSIASNESDRNSLLTFAHGLETNIPLMGLDREI
jgi:hypothetical protein